MCSRAVTKLNANLKALQPVLSIHKCRYSAFQDDVTRTQCPFSQHTTLEYQADLSKKYDALGRSRELVAILCALEKRRQVTSFALAMTISLALFTDKLEGKNDDNYHSPVSG